MAAHLGLPWEVFDGFVFILVTFDVVVGEVDWETAWDVDHPAFQVVPTSKKTTARNVPQRSTFCVSQAIQGKTNLASAKCGAGATKTLVTRRRETGKLVLWFFDHHRHLTGRGSIWCQSEIA